MSKPFSRMLFDFPPRSQLKVVVPHETYRRSNLHPNEYLVYFRLACCAEM